MLKHKKKMIDSFKNFKEKNLNNYNQCEPNKQSAYAKFQEEVAKLPTKHIHKSQEKLEDYSYISKDTKQFNYSQDIIKNSQIKNNLKLSKFEKNLTDDNKKNFETDIIEYNKPQNFKKLKLKNDEFREISHLNAKNNKKSIINHCDLETENLDINTNSGSNLIKDGKQNNSCRSLGNEFPHSNLDFMIKSKDFDCKSIGDNELNFDNLSFNSDSSFTSTNKNLKDGEKNKSHFSKRFINKLDESIQSDKHLLNSQNYTPKKNNSQYQSEIISDNNKIPVITAELENEFDLNKKYITSIQSLFKKPTNNFSKEESNLAERN